MQTSHVSNAANVLASTPAPNKHSDANAAAEPFGQVLSREVSQRSNANEPPKAKETGNAAPPPQQAMKAPAKQSESKAPTKPAEAKPAKETKAADKAQADEETSDVSSALPDDLLALVATVNELNTPATPATDTQPVQTAPVVQDVQQAIAPTALPGIAVTPDVKPAEPEVALPTAAPAIGTQVEATALATAGAAIKEDKASLLPKHSERGAKVELPAAATHAAVKAEDVNAQAAAQSASTKAQDFTAAMSDTLNGVANGMQPVQQQAGLHALQQHGAQSAERLTPRVGTPAWDQALGQKVVWMVAGEQQSASLTLNPPDLGPLQVVLNVSNSQANATFIAAQPEVRQALEAALPKLRDMLGEAGIQLGQASVNSGTPNQQGNFEQQGSQAARGHGHAGNREPAANEGQARVSRVQPASPGLGLVDTFV
ncbi:flagellar hook-length control protein FliK [Noviherbaspirillum sp. ST9]|uniref:flagellar hook-length control protein FliK n=1 Tax=Noviherbaspirillum sp. ST9 TaxID=3401606 RepID=UPI003B586E28